MKPEKLFTYVEGFVVGVTLTVTIAMWGQVSFAYQLLLVALLSLMIFAVWRNWRRENYVKKVKD